MPEILAVPGKAIKEGQVERCTLPAVAVEEVPA